MMRILQPGVSVLICTHNGARNLPATLAHLSGQQVRPSVPWEIILISNASTDDTVEVAGQLRDGFPAGIPFQVVLEDQPGKDRAVDRGLALAQYQFVLICDDDNRLCESYVQRAFDVMIANPVIGMLGGKGIPVFESTPPAWFGDVANYYAVGPQNQESGEVTTSKGFLWGAGAVINLNAYHRLLGNGFERIITFADYPHIARGEDIELCLAIKLAGYKIWYDEQLTFGHYISKDKLSWAYLVRLVREGGGMAGIIGIYKAALRQKGPARGRLLWLRKFARQVLSPQLLKWWWYVGTRHREGSTEYLHNLARLHGALSYAEYKSQYDAFTRRVFELKARLGSGSD
jgi:glycosyltransferase involved in cell wall biosynthesis